MGRLKDELGLLEAVFSYKSGKKVQLDAPAKVKPPPIPADALEPSGPKNFWDKLSAKAKLSIGKSSKKPKGSGGVGLDGSIGDEAHKFEKWISAGGVVLGSKTDLDHVYIRKAANNFGGWSFAKGRIDKGETQEQAALREVEEETGIVARIVPGGYLGLAEGSMSHTHYYLMYAERDLHKHDEETEKVLLATWTEAVHKLSKSGNIRDIKILTKAMDLVEKIKRRRSSGGSEW